MRDELIEQLADLLAIERDSYPRRANDMDSGDLAVAIVESDWFRERLAEAWSEGSRAHTKVMETWFQPHYSERMYWPEPENPHKQAPNA